MIASHRVASGYYYLKKAQRIWILYDLLNEFLKLNHQSIVVSKLAKSGLALRRLPHMRLNFSWPRRVANGKHDSSEIDAFYWETIK